jgi:hypothetical protein
MKKKDAPPFLWRRTHVFHIVNRTPRRRSCTPRFLRQHRLYDEGVCALLSARGPSRNYAALKLPALEYSHYRPFRVVGKYRVTVTLALVAGRLRRIIDRDFGHLHVDLASAVRESVAGTFKSSMRVRDVRRVSVVIGAVRKSLKADSSCSWRLIDLLRRRGR